MSLLVVISAQSDHTSLSLVDHDMPHVMLVIHTVHLRVSFSIRTHIVYICAHSLAGLKFQPAVTYRMNISTWSSVPHLGRRTVHLGLSLTTTLSNFNIELSHRYIYIDCVVDYLNNNINSNWFFLYSHKQRTSNSYLVSRTQSIISFQYNHEASRNHPFWLWSRKDSSRCH